MKFGRKEDLGSPKIGYVALGVVGILTENGRETATSSNVVETDTWLIIKVTTLIDVEILTPPTVVSFGCYSIFGASLCRMEVFFEFFSSILTLPLLKRIHIQTFI